MMSKPKECFALGGGVDVGGRVVVERAAGAPREELTAARAGRLAAIVRAVGQDDLVRVDEAHASLRRRYSAAQE